MDKLLTIEDVEELGPWTASTWRYWRHIGYGPKATRIGKRLVYKESDVRAWIDAKFAEGDQEPA